jgi:phytoene dehydrogenase-like protein
LENHYDIAIIGSGLGSLTAACLLAKEGKKVVVLEQNYLAGGCTSSYWRKGFVFEAGATTLVGMDKNMPLRYLLDTLDLKIDALQLELPMQVHLADNTIINKYQAIEAWILEAERVFGVEKQRQFWEFCYEISQFVWQTSLKQTAFPPTKLSDLWHTLKNVSFSQLRYGGYSLMSMKKLLENYGLASNKKFVAYLNEQLLITAQNDISEVNVLFGATALCYTNFGNYYVNGGLINLINPLLEYLEKQGSKVFLRHDVQKISFDNNIFTINCLEKLKNNLVFQADYLISGIPVNNFVELYQDKRMKRLKKSPNLLPSTKLNSAFQMGIGFKSHREFESLHHQIILPKLMPETDSKSIFMSLSHAQDTSRSDIAGLRVASISTHLHNPENKTNFDKKKAEDFVFEILEKNNLILRKNVVYHHSSESQAWEKWTKRKYGFVGGYPQYFHIKPWQMNDARLDGHKAYLCGDTAYPGQGIPGVVLSGIIAVQKLKSDWF